MFFNTVLLIIGIAILISSAEFLVKGASTIARALGVSTLIIGLTIVAFGTSAPELFVSATAAFKNSNNVANGNVIGSNIFNALMIIGISAIFTTLKINTGLKTKDAPTMMLALCCYWIFASNGIISRIEGALLFLMIIAYLSHTYIQAKKERLDYLLDSTIPSTEKINPTLLFYFKHSIYIILGLIGLSIGGDLIVDNAINIAKSLNISDFIIAATIVAIGTSLPELATTISASFKNEPDLALGNAIGSNIFNICAVVGISSLVTPIKVSNKNLFLDFPFMFFSCAFVFLFIRFANTITARYGIIFILIYVLYITLIIK